MLNGARLLTLWDDLRTGLWFAPLVMGLGGALIAALSLWFEVWLNQAAAAAPWFVYVGAADEARTVTSILLSSMITMASLVFSITMVVVTLAASQFGPRLVRNFTSSRQTQAVLGVFVMTTVHCMLTLLAIGWRRGEETLPQYAVTAAILLTLVSLGLLVLHLHLLARLIVSETVIARVVGEFDELLETLGPLEGEPEEANPDPPEGFYETARFVGPPRTGYVCAIAFDLLAAAAERADAVVGLTFRPGDFVIAEGGGVGIHPADRATPELLRAVDDALVIGEHRTPLQDPEFAIRHLVEIAVRALSPAINDPYTATAVINQLSASLARLFQRRLPPAALRDARGGLRVLCPQPTYGTLVSAAFDQIRQNGGDKPLVVIHMIRAVERLAPLARVPEQKRALAREFENILAAAARAELDPSDREDIEARARVARETLRTGRLRHA